MNLAALQLVSGLQEPVGTRFIASPMRAERGVRAFTLIEMLVVLGIIGIMAAMTLPSFKKAGKGNITEAASRQLLDDLAYARLKALGTRTKVYVVFMPNSNWFGAVLTPHANFMLNNIAANNVIGGQLSSYALYSPRSVGDQPGRNTAHYLTDWRSLPDGAFIPSSAFGQVGIFHNLFGSPQTDGNIVCVEGYTNKLPFPYIAFDEQGRLFGRNTNIAVSLVEGSILHPRDTNGVNLVVNTDAVETSPAILTGGIVAGMEYLVIGTPGLTITYAPVGTVTAGQTFVGVAGNPNYGAGSGGRVVQHYGVRIEWATGRAKAVKPELQ